MAGYDIFHAIQAPTIPVSLFGDAATQGIAAGNAQPTKTTTIIQGAIKGLEQGQQFQANQQLAEIRQNQIEQLPVTNALTQTQLQNAQTVADINKLQLDIDQNTKQLQLDAKKSQLEAAKIKSDNEIQTAATKKQIEDAISSPDINVQRKVLSDPKMASVMFGDSKYASQVLGALASNKAISDDEAKKLFERADFVRSQELKMQLEIANATARDKLFADLDKVKDNIDASPDITNSLAAAGIGSPEELWHRNVAIVPMNQKTYVKDKDGKDTNVVDTSVPDKYGGAATGKPLVYDIIIDGKRSAQPLIKETDAALLNKYINGGRQRYGITPLVKQAVAPVEATPQKEGNWLTRGLASIGGLAAPSTPPRNAGQINTSLSGVGIAPEAAAPILAQAQKEGSKMGIMEQVIDNIVPASIRSNVVEASFYAEPNESEISKGSRSLLETTATKLAENTMKQLNSGSSEVKQDLRQFAKDNNFKLTKEGFKHFYFRRAQTELSKAYDETVNIGAYDKIQANRAKGLLTEQTPEQIMATKRLSINAAPQNGTEPQAQPQTNQGGFAPMSATVPEPNVMENLDAKIDELTTRYNLPQKEADKIRAATTKVERNKYLKDQPIHVKAIAAVESAGITGAESETGVVGLMQVTKPIAAHYKKNRNNPQENVEAGTMLLEDLIRQFKGNKAFAYAAYNAGPATIKYAQKLAGGSENWSDLKPHLLAALTRYQQEGNWIPSKKIQELYDYPERVLRQEEVFEGSIPERGEMV